jgi:hypothetical protein
MPRFWPCAVTQDWRDVKKPRRTSFPFNSRDLGMLAVDVNAQRGRVPNHILSGFMLNAQKSRSVFM